MFALPFTGNLECAVQCAEQVFLLAVKVDLETFYVFQGAEVRFPVLGLEVIVVLANVSNEVKCPLFRRCPTQISLIVKIYVLLRLRLELM